MGMSGKTSRNGSILILALLLAGCSGKGAEAVGGDNAATPVNEVVAVDADGSNVSAPGPTIGGDGSQIALSGLTSADIDGAKLPGELACSFADPSAAVLLLAKGDAASAEASHGVVKVGTYVEDVSASRGFDGMIKGAVFSGKGKDVRIAVTGPAQGGGESPPHAATLTYDRADGGRRVFPGLWTCGP